MDAGTFFSQIRRELIARELKTHNSARIQTTTWISFNKDNDRVELPFNSKTTSAHRGDDLDQIVDGMIAHMEAQIENHYTTNTTTTTQKQSDYKVEQSSFTLIALF